MTFGSFTAGIEYALKNSDYFKQLPEKLSEDLAIAIQTLKDVLKSLEEDDWTCPRCEFDQLAGESNAAYLIRDALDKIK